MTLVLQGIALFAFVPLVLWLFLAQPLGPGWSLALGVAIIAGHRAVAAPWAARHAMRRCIWCGRPGQQAGVVPVASGPRTTAFAVCGGAHERLVRQFFGFLRRFRVAIGIGIFAPLTLLLAGTLLRALGVASLAHARQRPAVPGDRGGDRRLSSRSPTARLRRPSIPARPSPCTTSSCSASAIRCGCSASSAGGGCSRRRFGWAAPCPPDPHLTLASTRRGRHCHNAGLCIPPTRGTP